MSTNFPAAVDDGTTLPNPGANAPTNNPSLSGGQTNQNDAIKAIEAKIGTGASTPVTGRVFRGTGTGTSAWAQLVLTTDVTGTLPVANGGTGVTTLTIPASGILVGTTDAQDVTNKTLHDTFMGTTFMSQSATFRNIILDASVDYSVTQLVEIGAAFNLEVPATSTLEIVPFLGPQSFTRAQHDHSTAANGGLIGTNAVGPLALTTGSIYGGTASSSTNFNTTSLTAVQITSMSVTVTVPTNGRSVLIMFCSNDLYNSGAGTVACMLSFWRGTVGSGTQLQEIRPQQATSGQASICTGFAVDVAPPAGSTTYNIGLRTTSGANAANIDAAATNPMQMVVIIL